MNPENEIRLLDAPSFGFEPTVCCKICDADARAFDSVDFYRICSGGVQARPHAFGFSGVTIPYFRCSRCDFLFTDFFDDWSASDFSKFIYNSDYIRVDPDYTGVRPKQCATIIDKLISNGQDLRILDYGSGSGIFSDELRALGYRLAENFDPYSSPTRPNGVFDIITCFEVIEHSPRPLETLSDAIEMLKSDGLLLFSQTLQPHDIELIRCGWWYIGPRNGHISTFSVRTLSTIADKLDMIFYTAGGLYVFAPKSAGIQIENRLIAAPQQISTLILSVTREPYWHEIEYVMGKAFAWTAKSTVYWNAQPLFSGRNEITIPYLNQISEGFAERCKILINGTEIPTNHRPGLIYGEIVVERTSLADISLVQPGLECPASYGRHDERTLGLAMPSMSENS